MEDSYDSLRWYDYVIFVTALCVSLGIGIYYAVTGDKQRTTKEYLLGDKKMSVGPVALSSLVTGISGILMMGAPAEFYNHGITAYFACVGTALGVMVSAVVLAPTLYRLGFISINKYLEERFNTKILRLLSALCAIITQLMYIGLAIYGPAIALEAVSGIPFYASVLTTGIVGTTYSTVGGIKGVVGTDVFQGLVMYGGCLLVVILGSIKVGGISEVWRVAGENGRLDINFSWSPLVRVSFWGGLFGNFVIYFNDICDQRYYQRAISMRSPKDVMKMMFLKAPQYILLFTLTYMCGMVAFAYYYKIGCDPLQTGQIDSSNQILPFFLMNGLQIPGIPGLFVAVLFCAVLSSVSSSLNALAAVTWMDFIDPYFFKNITDFQRATANKIFVVLYGAVGIGFAFMFTYLQGNFLEMTNTVFSAFSQPIDGVFMVGLFCPWVEYKAAIIGLLGGFALQAAMSISRSLDFPWGEVLPTNVANCTELGFNNTIADVGENLETRVLSMISYQYYPVISFFTTIVITLIASIFMRQKKPVEPKLLVPVGDHVCCCLPNEWRDKLNCGVDHSEKRKTEEKEKIQANKEVENDTKEKPAYNIQVMEDSMQPNTYL